MTVVTVLEGEELTDRPDITGVQFASQGGYIAVHSNGSISKMSRAEFIGLLNPLTHISEFYYPVAGETVIPVSGYNTGTGDLAVFVNGVKLVKGTDYTESTSTSITLTVASDLGDVIELVIGSAYAITLAATSKTAQEIVAAGGETFLTVNTYIPGLEQIEVYFNGGLLSKTRYTETNANKITLSTPAIVGDEFRIIFNQVSTVLTPDPTAAKLTDGVTAPTAIVGLAQLYVDVADGNLKVRFGDAVTKTLAVDYGGLQSFSNSDATPTVLGKKHFITPVTPPAAYTAFDDGVFGQEILVRVDSAGVVFDFSGTTLKGNGGVDWSPDSGDFLTATFDGTNWLCQITDVTV